MTLCEQSETGTCDRPLRSLWYAMFEAFNRILGLEMMKGTSIAYPSRIAFTNLGVKAMMSQAARPPPRSVLFGELCLHPIPEFLGWN